jgi:hypothetical protein
LIAGPAVARIGASDAATRKYLQIPHFADITPDVSLLAKVGQSGHSVAEAISELVDNALDARVGGTVKVAICYDAGEGWVEISDNGRGMNRAELSEALVLGRSNKANGDIGRFGLGLKTACTSLGSRFQISTCPQGKKIQWRAEYDEQEFLKSGTWTIPIVRESRPRKRGTRIRIESSRIYSGLSQSLLRNLGSTFRHFIDGGVLELKLNGDSVPSVHQEIDASSVLPLDGEILGRRVRGWVGLLLASSQRGWYGFSLVRHRRVIRRHEKLGFRPHPSTARVVGELHLDDFAVNNLKTDFIRETEEWHTLEAWVSEQIQPVLAISRALAHSGTFDSNVKLAIADERDRILAALGPGDDLPLPGAPSKPTGISSVVNVVLGTTHLAHRFETGPAAAPHVRVEYVARSNDPDLIVVFTNADHPAMSAADPSQIACHNLADAAALVLGKQAEFIALKGQLLGVLLEQKPVRRALRMSAKTLELGPQDPVSSAK